MRNAIFSFNVNFRPAIFSRSFTLSDEILLGGISFVCFFSMRLLNWVAGTLDEIAGQVKREKKNNKAKALFISVNFIEVVLIFIESKLEALWIPTCNHLHPHRMLQTIECLAYFPSGP